jgi:sodium transport system permease protein
MRDFKLILHKELIDILRDKRSFIMLFVPVLLFPMMFILMGSQLNQDYTKDLPCIVQTGSSADEALYGALFEKTGLVKRTQADGDANEDLKKGLVYAIIDIRDGNITVTYNQASQKSLKALETLSGQLESFRSAALAQNLQTRYGVSVDALTPFTATYAALSDDDSQSLGSMMASIAPMLLVVIIMTSGVSVAVDLFTGEKERGTLESLMTTQASRMSLLMAKFTATLCVSLLGMTLSIAAYVISYTCTDSGKALLGIDAQDKVSVSSLGFSLTQGLELFAVCLTLSVFAVSMMTVIGLHAKTVKEAQSQMSLITLFPTLLAGLTLFMESADVSPAAMWIPIFNSIVSIKMIFSGTAETSHIVCTTAACLLYSGLMWIVSVKMLRSEKLLQG